MGFRQAKALFNLLDEDDSNAVGIDEFVTGCMRLRGSAKSIDVNMLLLENGKLMGNLREFIDHLGQRMTAVEHALVGKRQDSKDSKDCGASRRSSGRSGTRGK